MCAAKSDQSDLPITNSLPNELHSGIEGNNAQTGVLTEVEKTQDEFDYPEGGLTAWTVAIGSWCSMTAGLGIVNSTGVFEAYLSNTILHDSSTNAIAWIMGIYVFVSYFFGVQIGPIFDLRGPRELIFIGTVCLMVGTYTLAQSTEYYQILLSFSILSGMGNSFLFTPAMGAISHWFNKKRGKASGFAFIGSGFGGVLFPLIAQSLLPQVGWAWTIRIIGFILLLLCIVSMICCKSRLPPKHTSPSWRQLLPSLHIFQDSTGAMAFTSAGVFFIEWAYFVPVTYIPSYYLTCRGLTGTHAISGDAAFAYQLLAILNSASCFGRYVPGYIADKIGRYNTMIIGSLLALISVMALWLPDALTEQPPSLGLLIAFVIIYGFASGANITLTPICIGQLCSTQDYGRYYASAFTICSFGCLTSIPIAGNILTVTPGVGRRQFWGLILFAGLSYVVAFLCFVWVRVRIKGFGWWVRW